MNWLESIEIYARLTKRAIAFADVDDTRIKARTTTTRYRWFIEDMAFYMRDSTEREQSGGN